MSNPGDERRDSDHVDPPACGSHRRRLQAARRLAHRHRAREVRLPPGRPGDRRPICRPTASRASIRDLLTGMQRYDAHPDRRPRQHHRPEAGRRGDFAGAGRAARAVRRAAGDAARHQGRDGRRISPRCAAWPGTCGSASRRSASIRWPAATTCRGCRKAATPSCAATCRWSARLGLDMMTRTCTVQVNLDYGSEADMVRKLRVCAAAAAAGHRAVRQFAVHRGPAERLPVLPRPCLDRHRQRPLRHPAGDVRGRLRLRALRRVAGRPGADVFRLSQRRLHRRRRQPLPRLHGRAGCTTWPAPRPRWATSPTT